MLQRKRLHRRPRVFRAVARVLVVLAASATVLGADASRSPTPALFPDAVCMVTVDRSKDAVLRMGYEVPFDDTDRQPDEVEDGRTHQFFAFRRQFRTPPPNWITWDDVARAMAAPATDPVEVKDEDVLETTSAFAPDEWIRITPDDARLPITRAQAAMGVSWDTSGLPEGAYVVAAYTFDPALNLWSVRPGVVHVLDDASAEDVPPAAALTGTGPEGAVRSGDPVEIAGCVRAAPGAVVRPAYAFLRGAEDPEWIDLPEFAAEADPDGGLSFSFEAPEPPASSGQLVVRATVTDPQGRSYTAYLAGAVQVLASDGAGDGGGAGGVAQGCACTARDRGGGPGAMGAALLVPVVARRRRRGPAPGAARVL